MPGLDLDYVRDQFPAFSHPESARWAHLENAGGSYVPRQVSDLLHELFVAAKVQPYWDWGPSVAAGQAMDRSRELLAHTLCAPPAAIHFGPSTTQNTYVLAQAFRATMAAGDQIIVTNQDHEANVGAWRRLADTGIDVREWQVDPRTGLLDAADLDDLLCDRTRLVAVTHASNVAATINPVAELADRAHAVGAALVVDGVSYAPHGAIDVTQLGCDVYLYSAYKTYGPHVGVMYVDPMLTERLPNQGHYFNADKPTARLTPAGPDHAEIGAAGGIVDYYDDVYRHHVGDPGAATVRDRVRAVFDLFAAQEQALMAPLLELLDGRDAVHVVGEPRADHRLRAPTVAFWIDDLPSREIYRALVDAGVACGHGHFYAHRLVRALGLDPDDGVVRLSMVHYNTLAEVARACEVLDRLLPE